MGTVPQTVMWEQSHDLHADRVTMLTRENRTRGSGAPPEVRGLVWYTDESKTKEGTGASVFGQL